MPQLNSSKSGHKSNVISHNKEWNKAEVRSNHTNDTLLYMLQMYMCYIIIASLILIQK